MNLAINSETKIGALLEAYPGVEEALIAMAPPFENLRNPILRKTVARIATLGQAARIGGIAVQDLVLAMRTAAGVEDTEPRGPEDRPESPAPQWMSRGFIRHEIDGTAMLAAGIHPIGKVRECVEGLRAGEAVRLTTSFRPEPLIELMRRNGVQVFSQEVEPGRHETFFGRAHGETVSTPACEHRG